MILANLIVFIHAVAALALSWLYFRRCVIQRPPIGVFNLWDIAVMLGGIILVPYLYLVLPRWVVAGLLGLGLLSAVYFLLEPLLWSRLILWWVVTVCLGLEIVAVLWFGGQSTIFFAINNLIQILVVIGVTNLWAQSGLKARDAAILGIALMVYDFLFTSVLTVMTDLFTRLVGLPFAPLVAWPGNSPEVWLGFGLGDLLLAAVFPLVLRKAYGRRAGLMAMLLALGAIGALPVLALTGLLGGTFPVMVVLGPLMVLQYLYWHCRCGPERTTWQYLQAEPLTSISPLLSRLGHVRKFSDSDADKAHQ
jgi:hypothetical protein